MSRHLLRGDVAALSATSAYLERREPRPGWADRAAESIAQRVLQPLAQQLRPPVTSLRRVAVLAAAEEAALRQVDGTALQARLLPLRHALRREGLTLPLVARALALLREGAARRLGQRPYDVQLMGAWAMLQGQVAEMATGEGKTLTAALAAATAALSGVPVHVITVNDYLARRDAETMAPLFDFAGLSVGTVVQGETPHARRAAYRCDLTYCTNKELAFDYLKDRVAVARGGGRLGRVVDALKDGGASAAPLLLRGLHFALVDEADSIFIDEARTPLILSADDPGAGTPAAYAEALALAARLEGGVDYLVDQRRRSVELTPAGRARVEALLTLGALDAPRAPPGPVPSRAQLERVEQALSARELFVRDRHYVVTDGKVQIVDEFTGRVMPDRSWERGLHQMIEAKEGCELSAARSTIARITYQRLFRRYLRVAGMTGTAREVAPELARVYGLRTVPIPPHRPNRRVVAAPRLLPDAASHWQAVASAVRDVAVGQGRPVLVGTRSVASSEALSAVLTAAGIEHVLLNARQDRDEAELVAQAGQPGRVTVATNMAGRGTDIHLADGVAARGGLHVILTECHASLRIDRQLFGRCARQGDPGSTQAILSAEDEVLRLHGGPVLAAMIARAAGRPALLALLVRAAQRRAEAAEARVRAQTLAQDRELERALAFSGMSE